MKVIAAICADFERGALGTRSRLDDELAGETILRRTLNRVLAARRVSGVHLLVDASQVSNASRAVEGLDVKVETHHAGEVPWQASIASARKWSLDAWRGGLGGACVFDESLHPWLLEALGRREQAEGVIDVPAAACLLDPALLDAMIEHYASTHSDVRMAFTQSAPGLSAAIYSPELLGDLAKASQTMGRTMAYRPADPRRDMIMLPCFYAPETDIRRACGRCLADTGTALDRITAILTDARGDHCDAATVSRWLIDHRFTRIEALPDEVEIELTTQDPLANTTLRPRGPAVGERGPIEDAVFDRLIDELAERDDVRVMLGGFGDPLCHPRFARCLERCREAGLFALGVRTPAVMLDDEAIRALMEARVDVLQVLLDAATPETYRKVHQADRMVHGGGGRPVIPAEAGIQPTFDRVVANIERLLDAQRTRQQPQPLVVCEMTKTHATMDELEPFYDQWINRTGFAVLAGPSTYGGQWPDLSVMDMAPPTRVPCERIFTRATVLADGRVTVCDQDFRGQHAIGSVVGASLSGLWTGPAMEAVRRSHVQGKYDAMALCPKCREWHRP